MQTGPLSAKETPDRSSVRRFCGLYNNIQLCKSLIKNKSQPQDDLQGERQIPGYSPEGFYIIESAFL